MCREELDVEDELNTERQKTGTFIDVVDNSRQLFVQFVGTVVFENTAYRRRRKQSVEVDWKNRLIRLIASCLQIVPAFIFVVAEFAAQRRQK